VEVSSAAPPAGDASNDKLSDRLDEIKTGNQHPAGDGQELDQCGGVSVWMSGFSGASCRCASAPSARESEVPPTASAGRWGKVCCRTTDGIKRTLPTSTASAMSDPTPTAQGMRAGRPRSRKTLGARASRPLFRCLFLAHPRRLAVGFVGPLSRTRTDRRNGDDGRVAVGTEWRGMSTPETQNSN
jgi:hypothetical protein